MFCRASNKNLNYADLGSPSRVNDVSTNISQPSFLGSKPSAFDRPLIHWIETIIFEVNLSWEPVGANSGWTMEPSSKLEVPTDRLGLKPKSSSPCHFLPELFQIGQIHRHRYANMYQSKLHLGPSTTTCIKLFNQLMMNAYGSSPRSCLQKGGI